MSATLIALVPLALLGIVALLGFAGCVLGRYGTNMDPYDLLITNESGLVAFWPLTDPPGPTTDPMDLPAIDRSPNKFNGTYKNDLGDSSYDSVNKSAAASGQLKFNQPGIVPADTSSGVVDPSVFFEGGVVSVPFQTAINMDPPFSIEAWVLPDPVTWGDASQPALRGVVVSNSTSTLRGFGLFATPDNFWLFSLGVGSEPVSVQPDAGGSQIDLNSVVHLVATFDGIKCQIFASTKATGVTKIAEKNLDPTTQTYLPLQNPGTPLFIGAGLPENGTSPPPLFPVNANVQCVAIYKKVLDQATIQQHFDQGFGG